MTYVNSISALESEDFVEGGRRLHSSSKLGQVHVEVATDVNCVALATIKLTNDRSLVISKFFSNSNKLCVSLGESFSPVEGEIIVGSSVIGLIDLAAGSLLFLEPGDDSSVESGS
jgi:hypothetical protein